MRKTLLALFICLGPLCFAQTVQFRHITSREGLPYTWISDIYKDSEDFMWFSSIYGAYRYDGLHFEEYRFSDSDGHLASMISVREDSYGRLWFCTTGGLFCQNRESGERVELELPYKAVYGFCEDRAGKLWLGTRNGVYVADRDSLSPVAVKGGEGLDVNALILDSGQTAWVGTLSGEVYRFDRQRDSLLPVPETSSIHSTVNALFEDSRHNLWISTFEEGLFRLNPQNGSLSHFCVENGYLNSNLARQITEDASGNVWVCSEKGLSIFSTDGKVSHILSEGSNSHSLNDNAAYSIFCDESSNIWVGTFFGGVNVYSSGPKLFDSTLSSVEGYSRESKVVSSIIPWKDGIMIGTENDGVFIMQSSGEDSHIYTGNSNIAGDNVHAILKDKDGDLLVGTYYGGLSVLGAKESKFSSFPVGSVYKIFEDSRGNIWIGTQYKGLWKYDRSDKTLEAVPDGLPSNLFIWDIHEGRDGDLWLACFGSGLWRLHAYDNYRAEFIPTPSRYYVNICELKDGRFILGTEKEGIVIFDPNSLQATGMSRADGLPDDTVYGTLQDDQGNLWMSSNSGLYRTTPELDGFTNYTISDGLPANRFNYNACAKIGSKLYFGSTNGLVTVHPDAEALARPKGSRIRFNSLFVKGELVSPGSELLPRRLDPSRKLVLGSKQNTIGIAFSENTYNAPRKYVYRMQGLSPEWQDVPESQIIDFLGLSAGDYVLSVAPIFGGKVLEQDAASLQIRIRPLWWQSTPAIICFILLIGSMLFVLIYNFMQGARHRHELEIEKIEREKDREINETKFRFFVNISHEFKTPLSLIIGPAERLLSGEVKGDQCVRYLQIMKDNADKLLALVTELLSFREAQFATLQLSRVNAGEFLTSALQRYDWLFEGKKIQAEVSCSPDLFLDADLGKLEKIIGNLISNAYKHTGSGGHIKLSAVEEGECVRFNVEDDGEGISEDKLPHIFDRFFSGESYDKYSSGVGLSYVKALVELHHGSISASSVPGKKTVFSFVLPKKQNGSADKAIDHVENYALPSPSVPTTAVVDDIDDETFKKIASETAILIVEDDAQMKELLSDYFGDKYRVSTAHDCEEALKMVKDRHVDIVLSDVMLGSGMSGFELCKILKNDIETSHVKVILMTVLSEENYITAGYQAGVDDYIVKPFKFSLLDQRVKNLIIKSYRIKEAYKLDMNLSNLVIDATGSDEQLIKKAVDYILDNISDSNLNIDSLCSAVGMSKTTLYRKMKALTGQSAGEFILNVRLKYAARLLCESKRTVSEIAYEVGFSDPYYFSRAFKKEFGLSPKLWREKDQSKQLD